MKVLRNILFDLDNPSEVLDFLQQAVISNVLNNTWVDVTLACCIHSDCSKVRLLELSLAAFGC